jgi:hypothetical protein
MQITAEHIKKLKLIKKMYFRRTSVPQSNNWKNWSNNDVWLHLVSQVIVVGSSAPADKFYNNSQLRQLVSYNRLLKIKDENQLEKDINHVLRAVGARYASKSVKKCRKTQALIHNFKVLSNWKGGPKALLKRISKFKGPNESKRKTKYIMKIFEFIQSKSARDFLMELGLISDAIALDVRVQNVLRKKVGIRIPKGLENNPKLYDETEKELLSKVCKPLKLSGVQFDRMIYQNYEDMKKIKFRKSRNRYKI